jgi:hypothetical protein
MPWTYHLKRRPNNLSPLLSKELPTEVPATDVDAYFRNIELLTDLDRPMAETIMHGGHNIVHPRYLFWATEVRDA